MTEEARKTAGTAAADMGRLMAVTIKHRDGRTLYVAETAADVRAALVEATSKRAYLRGADLRGAYLGGADLRGAYLRGAYLGGAYLRDADLGGADLGGAYLGGAYLRGADLRGADLRDADLRGAYLRDADLRDADLGGADLGGADLRGADLRGADLRDADPSNPLWTTVLDFWSVLDQAPAEVVGLRLALVEGRVNGSTYEGACACLVGTLANVRGEPYESLDIVTDSSRLGETWFLPIREGDKAVNDPKDAEGEGSFRATLAVAWIDQWLESRLRLVAAFGGAST